MRRKQTALLSAAIALTIALYLSFNSGATAKGTPPRIFENDQFWQKSGADSPSSGTSVKLNTPWWEKTLRFAPLETPGAIGTQHETHVGRLSSSPLQTAL